MTENAKLKAIERKAFISYHQDGILDICIGSVILNIVIFIWLLPEFWFFIVGGLIAWMSVYWGIKKKITVPRIGYVEFSATRKRRTQNILLVGVIVLVFANLLSILAMIYPPLGIFIFESQYTILLIGIFGAIIFSSIGYISDMKRFYSYGIVVLASSVVTFFFPFVVILPLIVISLTILSYGLVLLYRFLLKYPKQLVGEVAGA